MSTLRLGVATADVTPPLPVWAAGYANRDRKSDGVAEPLRLTTAVFVQEETCCAVIAIDAIGLDLSTVEPIRAAVGRRLGIDPAMVQVSCSHTHFGPVVGPMRLSSPSNPFLEPEAEALALLTEAAEQTADHARGSLDEVDVSDMTISAPPIAFNRRFLTPDGHVSTHFRYPQAAESEVALVEQEFDDRLTVVRFGNEDTPRALLVHMACHPVCNADDGHYVISADYVHYLRETLEDRYQCPVLFLQGPAGDVVPADRFGDSRLRIGRAIADSIIANQRRFEVDPTPMVSCESVPVELDLCLRLPETEAQEKFEAAQAQVTEAGESASAELTAEYRYYQSSLFFDKLYGGRQMKTSLSILQIGPLSFVFLPFEVLSSFSLACEAHNPDVRIVGYSNGYQGYLPTAREAVQGGYEGVEGSRHIQLGEAERLLSIVLEHTAPADHVH